MLIFSILINIHEFIIIHILNIHKVEYSRGKGLTSASTKIRRPWHVPE